MKISLPGSEQNQEFALLIPGSSLSRYLLLFTGVILWAQLIATALMSEVAFAVSSIWRMALYILPLIGLVSGVIFWRRAGWLIGAFSFSLMISFLVVPDVDKPGFNQWGTMLFIGSTWIVYLWLACVETLQKCTEYGCETHILYRQFQMPHDKKYRRIQAKWRPILVVTIWLFVIVYTIYFDPNVAHAFISTYQESYNHGLLFASLVMFFVWLVLVYSFILLPELNKEYEQQQLKHQFKQPSLAAAIWRRVIGWLILVGVLGVAAILF